MDRDHPVASPSRDPAGPADQERHAQRTLPDREIVTPPGTSRAVPRIEVFRAVVARPDDDGVVANPEIVDGVQDLSGPVVHLGRHIRIMPVSGFSVEIRMRQGRQMGLCEGDEREERLLGIDTPLHEVN